MRFSEVFEAHRTTFSFEFFPPKTEEGEKQLFVRAGELAELKPTFASVTYGAGGSTREKTHEMVVRLSREIGLNVAAHLTCVGHKRDELIEILRRYRDGGIENIVALRGDVPEGEVNEGELRYGNELVELIRDKFGDEFGVAVAGYPEGHPETTSKLVDMDNLKRKVDAGADCVITQLFFEPHCFYDFRERCELAGINVPIIAGIMPIVSWRGIERMAGMSGAGLPARLLRRLTAAGDNDKDVEKIGIDWATWQSHDLLNNNVRGIHYYTLNRSSRTMEIYRRLGAVDSDELERMAEL